MEQSPDELPAAHDAPLTPPSDRYGTGPRRPFSSVTGSRALAVGLFALALACVVAVVYYVYESQTQENISGTQAGYARVDDHTMTLQFDVTRDKPATPVFCIVRAKAYSGDEVGRREVYVPPSTDKSVRMSTTIATTGPGVIADVYGCGKNVPGYLTRS